MPSPTALLVTRDDSLLEQVLRLAAAAGVVLDVAHDVQAALRSWSAPPVVLVGVDQLALLAERCPARREQVLVVGEGAVPDELFRAALTIGAEHVVELPAADPWVIELLTDVSDGAGAGRAVTVSVVGGCGGAGATTFASALAVTAARHGPALLLDADPLGGGIDRVVGVDEVEGARWESLLETRGRLGARSLRDALPRLGSLVVLSGAGGAEEVPTGLAQEVLSAAQRGNDCVVVDLPRCPGPVTEDLLSRSDHVLVLTRLTVPAVASTARTLSRLGASAAGLHLVARESRGGLEPADAASSLGVPLLLSMTDQRRLVESVDLGLGPLPSARGPLARACRLAVDALGLGSGARLGSRHDGPVPS